MKTRFAIICCGLLALLTGCVKHLDVTLNKKPEGKVLIVYYSQSENKNTQTVAKWIHEQTGGDLLEIEMAKPSWISARAWASPSLTAILM